MVDEELGRDLLSFGTPVLVLGDPAQLAPVKGGGFFTEAEPDVMLTEVHRQARDDPIIRLSMIVREGERARATASYGESRVISPRATSTASAVLAADQVLVGLNKTRRAYNARIRELLGLRGRCRPPATSSSACATTARRACSTAASGRARRCAAAEAASSPRRSRPTRTPAARRLTKVTVAPRILRRHGSEDPALAERRKLRRVRLSATR